MFTIPTWLIAILALAAIVCMAVAYKKQEDPKYKPLALVAVIILIVCAYGFIDNTVGIGRDNLETRLQNESNERFNEARIKAVAEYVKSKNPGKIVIIPAGGSDYEKTEHYKKQAELVKKYVGDAEIKPIPYTRKPEEMPDMMGPTAEEFNKFFKANADAKLFIVLETIPQTEIAKIEIFNSTKQQLAFIDSLDGNIQPYFKTSVLVAVGSKEGLSQEDYQKLAPKDLKEAFDARFILITKENADKLKVQ